jgi:VanZ family protein
VTITKALFYTALAAVAALSLTPAETLPDTGVSDKLGHVAAYWLLCLLGLTAHRGRAAARWVVIGLLCYGALMEGLQTLSPGRSMEGADILANGLGVLAGAVSALAARAIRRAAAN